MEINIYKPKKPSKTQTFARYLMLVIAFLLVMGISNIIVGQTLLDNYDGVGDLTYTTEGSWSITGGQYVVSTAGITTPEHSYASYDISNSIAGWSLLSANQNSWFGWMDLNRASVGGWDASSYSCAMVLASNNADFNAGTTSGYAIGFRNSDDALVLFRFIAGIVSGTVELPGTSTQVIATDYIYANDDNGVNFYVEKLPTGEFKVYYLAGTKLSDADAPNKSNYTDGNFTSAVENTYTGAAYKYAGWAYSHSNGADDKAYFDNFGAGQSSVSNVTAPVFANVCINSLDLSWTLPSGYNAGTNTILVFAKASSNITLGTPTNNVSTYTANSNFSGAGTPYQNDALAKCVYKGDGTTVSITGLNAKTNYYFLIYNVLDPNTYSTGTLTNIATAPTNISPFTAASANGQITLTWTNPTTCYDEIMIVAKPSAPITANPSGDGTAYTANLAFGSGTLFDGTGYVVYKGSASPQTVTALTNGTVYYFKAFTRRGTNWSNGVEINATPSTAVINDYRSNGSGAWYLVGNWQQWNGSSWVAAGAFPNATTVNVTIRNGHTITLNASGYDVNNFIIENGGKIYTNTTLSGNRYINIWGSSLVCDGTIGNGSTYDEICFNIEGTDVTISGTGTFDCSRIRKNANTNPTSNLTISRNINLRWGTSSGTSLYNNAAGVFNVLINAGAIVSLIGGDDGFGNPVTGNCSIDGLAGTDGGLNSGSITVNGTLKITGTLYLKTNNATAGRGCSFIIGSTGVVYIGTIDAAASGAAGNTLTINNGGKLVITGLTPFTAFSTTNNTYNLNAGSIVEYAANGDQAIQTGWGAYSNLILSNSGNKSLSSALDVNIDMLISGSSVLVSNNNNVNVGGNWTNYGTAGFTEGTSTVIFDGTTNQTINCGGSKEEFYNFTVNKNSENLSLNNNIGINNILMLTKGNINTGTFMLELGYDISNTGTLDPTIGGYINGNMKRWFDAAINTGTTGLFPIGATLLVNGNINSYCPIQINFTTAPTTGGSLTAQFITSIPANYYDGLPLFDGPQEIDNLADEGLWQIDANTITGGYYTCVLSIEGLETVGNPDNIRILKRPVGGLWIADGTQSGNIGIPIKSTRTGMSGFSQFALGGLYGDGNPLPINLLNFSAKYTGSIVDLNWSTASESNNDFFTIERSADASSFNAITSIKGAGNSNSILHYTALDAFPLKGINYYRLKQTDYNSKYAFSKIISVNTIDNNCELEISQLYMQSNTLNLTLNCIDSKICIDIIDITGRVVFSQNFNSLEKSQNILLTLPALIKGVYFAKVTSDKTVVVKKFSL